MYEAFYGLQERPFNLTPDPKYLFLSDKHKEAFAHLLFGIKNRSGFVMVTGEIGTGKTTISRNLLNQLDADTEVAFIFNPALTGFELLKKINAEFGIDTSGENVLDLTETLNHYLLEATRQGKSCVLVIDEAQNLDPQVLEQIRLLSNLETETEKLLQIILIGQPELSDKLALHELRQLNQRITARYHLRALSEQETLQYIAYRLHTAGGRRAVKFASSAVKAVYRYSAGTPRVINAICDRALLIGYTDEVHTITKAIVERAAKEIKGEHVTAQPRGLAALKQWLPSPSMLVAVALVIAGVILFQRVLPNGAVERENTAAAANGAAVNNGAVSSGAADAPAVPAPEQVAAVNPALTPNVAKTAAEAAAPAPVLPTPSVTAPVPAPAAPPAQATSPPPAAAVPPAVPAVDIAPQAPAPAPAETAGAQPPLAELLATTDPAVSREGAAASLLAAWSRPAGGPAPASDAPEALAAFAQQHQLDSEVLNPAMDQLIALGLPAFVKVKSGEKEQWVSLITTDEQGLRLTVAPGQTWPVSREEFLRHYMGQAVVLWQDLAPGLPRALRQGHQGQYVAYFKEQLRRLGRIPQENTDNRYDAETARAVARLQAETGLHMDGMAGRQVRMVLSSWLPSPGTPSFRAAGEPVPLPAEGLNETPEMAAAPSAPAAPAPAPAPRPKRRAGRSYGGLLSNDSKSAAPPAAPAPPPAEAAPTAAAEAPAETPAPAPVEAPGEAAVAAPAAGAEAPAEGAPAPAPEGAVATEAPTPEGAAAPDGAAVPETPVAAGPAAANAPVEERLVLVQDLPVARPDSQRLEPADLSAMKESTPPAAVAMPLMPKAADAETPE